MHVISSFFSYIWKEELKSEVPVITWGATQDAWLMSAWNTVDFEFDGAEASKELQVSVSIVC